MTETEAVPELNRQARAELTASVDRWDAAARLEASGISTRLAEREGYPSTFALAADLLRLSRPERSRPAPGGLRATMAALSRSIVILCGVLVCVSTIPPQSSEFRVFMIAAMAWLAGQCVSAATWYGWGRGHRGDAAAAGLGGMALMVALAALASLPLGDPTALVWVMWTASLPVLMILRPGPLLTGLAVLAAATCLGVRQEFGFGPAMGAALVATTVAVVSAVILTHRIRREMDGQIQPGHLGSVGIATIQTLGQLATLGAIVMLIGPSAFGGVAVAGLFAGLAADPAFELAKALSGQVAGRTSHWRIGTILIGGMSAIVVVLVMAVSAAVTGWFLDDPYLVYPDMPLYLACSALVGALTAGISIQLRCGHALGAMVLALVTAFVVFVAALVAQSNYRWDQPAFAGAAVVVGIVATVIASRCLANPRSW